MAWAIFLYITHNAALLEWSAVKARRFYCRADLNGQYK